MQEQIDESEYNPKHSILDNDNDISESTDHTPHAGKDGYAKLGEETPRNDDKSALKLQ